MILGVAVDKSVMWRGQKETYTNVWHYDTTIDTTSKEIADAVVDKERALMGTNVSFNRVQVWGPTDGTKEASQMLHQEDLSGTGGTGGGQTCALETTAVVSWNTGRFNSRGGRIYLRKYLHLGQLFSNDLEASKGNTALPSSDMGRLESFGNAMKNLQGTGFGAAICDKKGRKLPLNTPAAVLPHLHTRQFRR